MPRKKSGKTVVKEYGDETLNREAGKPFKKYYSLEKYDRTLRNYRDKLKVDFSRAYDKCVEMAKSKLNVTAFRMLKTEGVYRKRRIAAYVDTAVLLAEKFEEKFPNISIESEFCDYSSAISAIPPDYLEEKEHMTLAAALFILDAVKKSGNFYFASFFIPNNEETEKEELPFEFQDSVYSNDIIQGVIYLIKNRHGSEDTYYSRETAAITPDNVKFCEYRKYGHENYVNEKSKILKNDSFGEEFTGRYIRYYETAEKMSLQEKYYALISFIRPEIIERAVKRFRDINYELTDIILDMASQSRAVCVEIAEKSKKSIDSLLKINTVIAEKRNKVENQLKHAKVNKTAPNVLFNRVPDEAQIQQKLDMISDISAVIEKYDSIQDDIDQLVDCLIDENRELRCRFDMLRQCMTGRIDKSEEESVRNLKIQNPYEIIFGFLYLIDSGDSLVWIPHLAECVCGYASQLLPWADKNTDVLDDMLDERYEREAMSEAAEPDDEDIPWYQNYVDDDSDRYEDEYTLKYNDAFMFAAENLKIPKDSLVPYNLAQIIYTDSSVVPPRYDEDINVPVQGFVKSGFTRKQAELMQYYKALAETQSQKLGFEMVRTVRRDINELQSGDSVARSVEDLKKDILVKNEEIETLKKELYAAKKKASESEKKVSGMKEEYASDLQELLELRELIYKIQNSSGDEENVHKSSVSFPYRTKARVVVYGGHATWLKVIVKLLPNVKFIDPYTDPDANSIRNADVVWMQTNAMPHSRYSKVMEIVRINKIPVKYFAYASAEKCALQLAEYDAEEKRNN